eukprot:7619079-Pyramimonas_sp.AAC.1
MKRSSTRYLLLSKTRIAKRETRARTGLVAQAHSLRCAFVSNWAPAVNRNLGYRRETRRAS